MINYLLVFAGGGLGSAARFGISLWMKNHSSVFPWATLCSNAISSFILGMTLGLLAGKNAGPLQAPLILFIAVGFCGGFSTFSTFSFETIDLIRSGNVMMALSNIGLNLLICLALTFAGLLITKP